VITKGRKIVDEIGWRGGVKADNSRRVVQKRRAEGRAESEAAKERRRS
jgi:hypothetical protein